MENQIIVPEYRKYHIKYRIGENTFDCHHTPDVPKSTPIDFVEEIVIRDIAKEYFVNPTDVIVLEFGLLYNETE